MSKAIAFLSIYPMLYELMEGAHEMWERVEGVCREGWENNKARYRDDWRNSRHADSMAKALEDDSIRTLRVDFYAPLSEALRLLLNATDFNAVERAERMLNDGANKLADFINTRMVDALGEWGAYYFNISVDFATGFDTPDFDRGIAKILPDVSPQKVDLQSLEAPPESTETRDEALGDSHDDPALEPWVFRRSGAGYWIVGCNEKGYVSKLVGFDYIGKLIRDAKRSVPMAQLLGAQVAEKVAGDECSWQPALGGEEEKNEIRKQLQELDAGLEKAKRENDFAGQTRLEKQREELVECVKRSLGIGGRDRNINNRYDKYRARIHGALKRAYKTLRSADPPMSKLADHFERSISSKDSVFFIYEPESIPPWSCDSGT